MQPTSYTCPKNQKTQQSSRRTKKTNTIITKIKMLYPHECRNIQQQPTREYNPRMATTMYSTCTQQRCHCNAHFNQTSSVLKNSHTITPHQHIQQTTSRYNSLNSHTQMTCSRNKKLTIKFKNTNH
jgi:hypothetical protein